MAYNFTAIEKKWQQYWLANKSFAALDPAEAGEMPKKYILDMFPYPSGAGLHVGHPEGYTATDIVSRYFRMKGFNVLHPMGWDAFGLPAEQHAIKTGEHPRLTTEAAIKNFRRQIQMLGLSYDWDREVDTTDPAYYKWTQWIFLQLFNSYFDPIQQKAMPIAHLMNELVNENYVVAPDMSVHLNRTPEGMERIGGKVGIERLWRELSEEEQAEVLEGQRLAYQDEIPVNWCPGLGTVLSNEEVIDGKSEVGGYPVERRPMLQWMLRITAYADRLTNDLNQLDWPESLKEMQRNWIGKSVGAEVDFDVSPGGAASAGGGAISSIASEETRTFEVQEGDGDVITVFTTRPDTLYGATYMVLAPEHPLVEKITTVAQKSAVEQYRAAVAARSERDRMAETKEKTGVFTGAFAINPVNKEPIPVWIADYVLMGYGTGAIMAVSAHDERDFEFAKKFGLTIRAVIQPPDSWLMTASMENIKRMPMPTQFQDSAGRSVDYASMDAATQAKIVAAHEAAIVRAQKTVQAMGEKALVELRSDYVRLIPKWPCFSGEGIAINSLAIDGLPTAQAKEKITTWLEEQGVGHRSVKYKLRDWLFSRQRYWGEPFPIVLDEAGNAYPLDASELPLTLPSLADFKPTGTPAPALSKAKDWIRYTNKAGEAFTRETNTMPQWAGSCWYYLRYIDPKNDQRFVDPAKEQYWMPVDLYVGGVEHAVLHLLYSRFWHKVLFDLGHVSTPEPFQRLVNQGLILGEMEFNFFEDAQGKAVSTADIRDIQEEATETGTNMVGYVKTSGAKLTAKRIDEILIEKKGDAYVLKANASVKVDARMFKMSKARGNVVNPDNIVADYGADAFRLYEMYFGPLEAQKPWNTRDIVGMSRFLESVWRNLIGEDRDGQSPETGSTRIADVDLSEALDRQLHRTIKKVGEDIEALRFNTAIAELIKVNNELKGLNQIPQWFAEQFTLLLAPFAPHLAEEIWHRLDHEQSLARHAWPNYDTAKLVESTMELPVQVNGKLRSRITVPADASSETILTAAKAQAVIKPWLEGKTLVKELYVPKKLVNFVVK